MPARFVSSSIDMLQHRLPSDELIRFVGQRPVPIRLQLGVRGWPVQRRAEVAAPDEAARIAAAVASLRGPWAAGVQAAASDAGQHANPHPMESEAWREWQRGYRDRNEVGSLEMETDWDTD